MFYFIIKIFICLIIILISYYLLNKKEINVLERLILLFIFNICIYSFNNDLTIINTILVSILVILCYYLFIFLYDKKINNSIINDNVLINRGLINFNNLIKEKVSYNNLLYELKKKGINDITNIDYCIKRNNDFIIFKNNSIINYPISIIIDGNIIKDNLLSINKSIEWLNKKIDDNNLELKNINYAYYKNKEIYFVTS